MNAPARIVRLRADAQVQMACEDNLDFMRNLESDSIKLIVTSPPYNIGKAYERRDSLESYVKAQHSRGESNVTCCPVRHQCPRDHRPETCGRPDERTRKKV
jgi:DNA modification methylase